MNEIKDIEEKTQGWLYDHPWAKNGLEDLWIFIVCTLSALLFAFGFNAFMDGIQFQYVSSTGDLIKVSLIKLVSGGVSGVSQNLTIFFEICGWKNIDEKLAESIMYFVINIPLIILAWRKIGHKFTAFTLINVAEVSLFIKFLTVDNFPFLAIMANFVNTNGGLLARSLFAGVCTGLSSALAFKVDISAGGLDVIAYYIALKKNTLVGKYSMFLNAITVILFSFLVSWQAGWDAEQTAEAFSRVFYSVIYVLVCTVVIDSINVRNKKLKIEIVTTRKDLASVLISRIAHGATVISGTGAYSGSPRYVIEMVVSSYEVSKVTKIIRQEDPQSFVQITPLASVFGRFHVKPIK